MLYGNNLRAVKESSFISDPFSPIRAHLISFLVSAGNNLSEATTKILSTLTPREERVLRMRFGVGMNTDHTLEEVGLQFSVTRERIRQSRPKR